MLLAIAVAVAEAYVLAARGLVVQPRALQPVVMGTTADFKTGLTIECAGARRQGRRPPHVALHRLAARPRRLAAPDTYPRVVGLLPAGSTTAYGRSSSSFMSNPARAPRLCAPSSRIWSRAARWRRRGGRARRLETRRWTRWRCSTPIWTATTWSL